MKKFLALIMALLMLLPITACDSKSDEDTSTTSNSADTEPTATTGSNHKPEPEDGKNTYTGLIGNRGTTVIICDDKASYTIDEEIPRTAAEIEEMGLSGTLTQHMITRYELTSAVVADGMITLSGSTVKTYEYLAFTGTAADAYKTMAKDSFDAALKNNEMSQEEYDKYMSFLRGEEIFKDEQTCDMTVKIKVNEADKTCFILSTEVKGIYQSTVHNYVKQTVFEYSADGKAVKTTEYNPETGIGVVGPYAEVTTYYSDGKTVKTLEECSCLSNEDGSYRCGDLKFRYEYREDGKTLRAQYSYFMGRLESVSEYDENGKFIKMTKYDENGNVIIN